MRKWVLQPTAVSDVSFPRGISRRRSFPFPPFPSFTLHIVSPRPLPSFLRCLVASIDVYLISSGPYRRFSLELLPTVPAPLAFPAVPGIAGCLDQPLRQQCGTTRITTPTAHSMTRHTSRSLSILPPLPPVRLQSIASSESDSPAGTLSDLRSSL